MIFLKTLIYFVKKGSVEVREDLLGHTESNVFKVAYLLFQYNIAKYKKERWIPMRLQISTLVLEMKPVRPQVYEIYTQALSSLNFSRQLLAPKDQDVDDGAFVVAINFLDSLVTVLSEMVQLDTCMDSMKGQRLDLLRRLVSLRTIVKKQPTSFDKKLVKSIADAVRDAGIVICSFHQTHVGTDHRLHHLLDIITIILADVEGMDVKVTVFNSPKTSSYGFLDYILEKLMELTSCEVESTAKSHIQTIQEELAFTRSSLGKVMELHEEQEEIQTLWGRLLEVAYKVESLLDHLVVGGLPDIVSTSFDTIMGDISNIKAGALKIQFKAGRSKNYSWMPSQTTPSISNEVIGFKNEERPVLDRLQRGSQQLRVIAIVGMPGQVKTTLAAKVYNHSSTSLYFSVRAWCPISQALDKKKVLCDLLKQVDPNINLEMAEHDLADKLRCCLKGKSYIIFLDDIWNLEAWNTLKDSFPNYSKGSRIIFTSRSLDASPHEMLDQEPLILSELSREESLELLQRKLFPGKGNGCPPQLHDIGMQIAEKCKGLPHSIIILAGILADIKPEGWKKILDSFSLVSSADYCRYTLELSYKHLPDYLRPCFLYFGAFPEDQEVSVRRLLRIWIGEGFVRKPDMKRHLNDVAEDYLKQLIGRSLIMSVKQRYDGGIKTCRIHDLLREFCLQKAKDEHFFHFLKGYDEFLSFNVPNVPHSLRRLCIDSKP